jgi:hypothetical protein
MDQVVVPAVRSLDRPFFALPLHDTALVVPIRISSHGDCQPRFLLSLLTANEELEELTFLALIRAVPEASQEKARLLLNRITPRTKFVRFWIQSSRVTAATELDLLESSEPSVAIMLRFSRFEKVVKAAWRLPNNELKGSEAVSVPRTRVERNNERILNNLGRSPEWNALSLSPRTDVQGRAPGTAPQTRDRWLLRVMEGFVGWFEQLGAALPDNIRIACSWPSRGGTGRVKRVVGQCWPWRLSNDGTYEIFISPTLDDAIDVAGTLLHELIHAALGCEGGHGPRFRYLALALGLEGRMTSTVVGSSL